MPKALKTPPVVPRLKDDDARKLARDIIQNKVFFAIAAEDVSPAFGGFFALFANDLSKEFIESIGAVWEYMEKAGPFAVNGYPMFLSCHFVNVEDVPDVLAELKQLKAVLEI